MPILRDIKKRLRERLPERLKQLVPEEPIQAPRAPEFDPERPPVSTAPESGFATGPSYAPIQGPAHEYALHDEGHIQYNVGDPVEFDAGMGQLVDAVHIAGPPFGRPRRLPAMFMDWADWEEAQRASQPYWPFRALNPGDVQVRAGAQGTISAISDRTVTVATGPHEVQIRDGALTKRELAALERHRQANGLWAFGFLKENAVPLKLEEERVWADAPRGAA